MKKFTKVVAVLFCLLISLSVLAETDKPKPFAGFDLVTLKNILSGDKVKEAIKTEGLPTVIGRMIHVQAEKTGQLNGLELDQLSYGKAVAVYNAFPNDLTPEKVLEIRDGRGLHFLPADYSTGNVHPSVSVKSVSETEAHAGSRSIIKPSAKPEVDPAYLFAKQFQDNQERIKRQEAELARLRVANKNNATLARKITELEAELESLRSLMGKLEQAQRELALGHSTNVGVQEGHQKLLDEISRGLQRNEVGMIELRSEFNNVKYIVWGLVVAFIILAGVLWRSNIFMRRQFASVNGRLNEHDKELEQISVKMLNLSSEEAKLLSKASIRNMDVGDEVTVLIPIKYGNDTAEWPLTVEKIDENTIRVNIPARHGSKDTHQKLDVKTSLLKTLDNAICDKRFGPSGLKKVA